jgi:hypothetical protein
MTPEKKPTADAIYMTGKLVAKVGLTIGFLISFALPCLAQEYYPFFRGIRQEGMGGAGVAVVDDETALFINPSGLGKIRGPYFSPLNIQAEVTDPTQAGMVNNTGDSTAFMSPKEALDLALKNPYQHIHAEAQTLPAFVTTNFGIGVYGRYSVDAEVTSASNSVQMNYFNDYGAELGYCFRLFSGRIKIGVAGKIINRVYVNQTYPVATDLSLQNIAQEGTGAGLDTSIMLTAPWAWLPSITAVVHDVGGTNFTLGNGLFYKTGINPPPQAQEINAGLGLFPIFSSRSRASITAEWDDLLNAQPLDAWRSFHAGVEFNFNDVLFIRGGVNEHYWTAGLEVVLGHNQIQLASYGEEIGVAPQELEDRRYVVQYGFRF